MNQEASHKGSLPKDQLQRSLQMAEAALFKLVAIGVRGFDTISTHDNATPVPSRSLVLVEDNEQGTVGAPAGAEPEPICRGEAMIGGSRKKVAAFRKKPA